jgi:peptide/nickel transport system ATP-binding protein
MPAPLLDIRQLSVEFVTNRLVTKALKNINISVRRGELLAIVGESGSGKSVTSLSILQLLPSPPAIYTSGHIELTVAAETIDLLKAPAETLQAIRGNEVAMIFQEPMSSLNPVLTCGFQVMEAIQQHKKISGQAAMAQTIALFEKVQLPDPGALFARYPHQLSGGQKQRVMIAMAMSCNPALLICDEPTTALDVTVQKNILQLIRELQLQNDMGVIFITHDLGVVAEIADRVAVMYRGEIVEQGPAAAIFNHPSHPYTKALLACRPALHEKGERLPVVSDFMEADNAGKLVEKSGVDKAGATSGNEHKQTSSKYLDPKLQTTDSRLPTSDSAPVPLLSVKHLKVYFPAKKTFLGKALSYTKAVDDVSFDVYPGETLGLVGESGCGKSTLGRAILRLVEATGGQVQYKGIDLLEAPPRLMQSLRKDMQIIFQDPYSSLNPRIKIGDAIAEPLAVHGIIGNSRARKEKVLALLEKVDLRSEHYHRYPHEFSGGQRQRIVIARALALEPSFVICDESVSALDVSVQAQVLNLLNDLKKEFGFTAIFISHDLSVVKYLSDRIMVMNKGRIEEIGPAAEVYNNPATAYTRRLIESIPRIKFG